MTNISSSVARAVVVFYALFSLFSILLEIEVVFLFKGTVLNEVRCREKWDKLIQCLL